ncbi:MAG: BMP family lipoprotein [Oceanidesulfovibrio sp.]
MKRRIAAILALAVLLFVPGAGSAAEPITVAFLAGAGGLKSPFNQLAYDGLLEASKNLSLEIIVDTTIADANDPDLKRDALKRVIDLGEADLVIASGREWVEEVRASAEDNPKVLFSLINAKLEGLDNVSCVEFAEEEGGFLAGALAAWVSKTGLMGFIGGMNLPEIEAFAAGYAAGVHEVGPQASVYVEFLSKNAHDFKGFRSPELGYSIASQMYASGVDVVFAAAGASGEGVIRAAQETGAWAIGVDYDQDNLAEGHVLTSVIKRVDNAVLREVSSVVAGKFNPGVHVYGVKNGGIGLSPMTYTREGIGEEILAKLKALGGRVAAGEIDIPETLPAEK